MDKKPRNDQHHLRQEISALVGRVAAAAREAAEMIQTHDAGLPAYAAILPMPQPDPENPRKLKKESVIEVGRVTDDEARARIAAYIQKIEYEDDQPRVSSQRMPGVFAASPKTLEAIERLNAAKVALEEKLKPVEASVWNAMRRADEDLRRLHCQQVYKQLPFFPEPPQRITFHWDARNTKVTPMRVPKVIEVLQERRLHPPADANPVEWEDKYDRYIETVKSETVAGERLAFREVTAAKPIAQLFYPDSGWKPDKHTSPLVVPDTVTFPDYTPLETLDTRTLRPAHGQSMFEPRPLIEKEKLWQYRDPFKFGGEPAAGSISLVGNTVQASWKVKGEPEQQGRDVKLNAEGVADLIKHLNRLVLGDTKHVGRVEAGKSAIELRSMGSSLHLRLLDKDDLVADIRYSVPDAKKLLMATL